MYTAPPAVISCFAMQPPEHQSIAAAGGRFAADTLLAVQPLLGWFVVGRLSVLSQGNGFSSVFPIGALMLVSAGGHWWLCRAVPAVRAFVLLLLLALATFLALATSGYFVPPVVTSWLAALLWGLLSAALSGTWDSMAKAGSGTVLAVLCGAIFAFAMAGSRYLLPLAPASAVLSLAVLVLRSPHPGKAAAATPIGGLRSPQCLGLPDLRRGGVVVIVDLSMCATMASRPMMLLLCGAPWPGASLPLAVSHGLAMFGPWALVSARLGVPKRETVEYLVASLMLCSAMLASAQLPATTVAAMLAQALAWSCAQLLVPQCPAKPNERMPQLRGLLAPAAGAAALAVAAACMQLMRLSYIAAGLLAYGYWLVQRRNRIRNIPIIAVQLNTAGEMILARRTQSRRAATGPHHP